MARYKDVPLEILIKMKKQCQIRLTLGLFGRHPDINNNLLQIINEINIELNRRKDIKKLL
jgi:hypothetical protein